MQNRKTAYLLTLIFSSLLVILFGAQLISLLINPAGFLLLGDIEMSKSFSITFSIFTMIIALVPVLMLLYIAKISYIFWKGYRMSSNKAWILSILLNITMFIFILLIISEYYLSVNKIEPFAIGLLNGPVIVIGLVLYSIYTKEFRKSLTL